MPFSIVIPSNNAERLSAVLTRIHEMEPELPGDRVVVIDDGIDMNVAPLFGPWFDSWEHFRAPKPFIFARNVNLGLLECARRGHDAILLNDDALLETPGGFTMLESVMAMLTDIGILSPTCNSIGNPNQAYRSEYGRGIAYERRMLCFVCVYIRLEVFADGMLLDERYVDYGMDDDDYCRQAREAGWKLGVLDSVRVDHKTLASAYRGQGAAADFRPNLRRYIAKWGVDNWGNGKDKSQFPECFE